MSLMQVRVWPAIKNGSERADTITGYTDPSLAFMLAQQATTQWRFEAERYEGAADLENDSDELISETEATIRQIAALRERIEPFENFVAIAIRYEAQEVLAALDAVKARMARVVRRLQPDLPWRDPAQLVEAMMHHRGH